MLWKVIAGAAIALVLFVVVAWKTSFTVVVERTFNGPGNKVWKLWNDPESIKRWWSPKNFTAPVIKSDFRVGGAYLFSMKSPQGKMFWNTGTYKELVPNQKIVSTMSFSDESGRMVPGSEVPVPGKWPDEISVTVEFKEVGGKTHVTIKQVGIPLIMNVMAKMGWEQQFDKFEALL